MDLVGLVGYADVGKDSVAAVLDQHYGFRRRALADKVREALLALNPTIEYEGACGSCVHTLPLADLVDQEGWEGAKRRDEVRELLQRMGTEVGRNMFGQDVWIDLLEKEGLPSRTVITDIRFHNELDWVKAKGGSIWRILRPGFGPVNDHLSESCLDDCPPCDLRIKNDGSIADLDWKVAAAHQFALAKRLV